MKNYEHVANFFGTTIADNPSPGNIADGLITDAIKSAGAAKKAAERQLARYATMPNRWEKAAFRWSARRATMWTR